MNILQQYINKQNSQFSKFLDNTAKPASIFVVIPCYNEPDILITLNSLSDCYAPKANVSVLVVVNDAEDSPAEAIAQNMTTMSQIKMWKQEHQDLFFDVQRIYAHALPQKWAGVGWARKIGMDEAVRQIVNGDHPDGVIISFDADCKVSPNYLQTVEAAFEDNRSCNFFTIHFEHPIDGPELSSSFREAIMRYELHMRYYRNAMKWSGYPHAIYTVGSGFAVKASAYAKQGGMNRRKAGEDFYFLHKLVLLGKYGNISTTTVFPSARQSDRVPFGTGAAMKKWSEGGSELCYTYSFEAFCHLKQLFSSSSLFYQMTKYEIELFFGNLHPSLDSYCKNSGTADEILELKGNCSNEIIFGKRFFHLFNAFWILKYLNFAHEIFFQRSELISEVDKLLQCFDMQLGNNMSVEYLLERFRIMDKEDGIE